MNIEKQTRAQSLLYDFLNNIAYNPAKSPTNAVVKVIPGIKAPKGTRRQLIKSCATPTKAPHKGP